MARTTHPFFLALPLAASLGLPAHAQEAMAPMDGVAIEACTDAMVGPCVLPDGTFVEGVVDAAPIQDGLVGEQPLGDAPVYLDPMTGAPIEAAPAEPAYVEPVAPMEPATIEPGYVEPMAEEPVYVEPTAPMEPTTIEPAYVEPMAEEPVYVEPMAPMEPATIEPAYVEPMAEEPVYVEPVAPREPVTVDPIYVEPLVEEPPYVEPQPMDVVPMDTVVPETMTEPVPMEPIFEPLVDPDTQVDPIVEPTEAPIAEPMPVPDTAPVEGGGDVLFPDTTTPEVAAEPTTDPMATEPVAEPTVEPTMEPTMEPTVEPTAEPVGEPTPAPSEPMTDGTAGGVGTTDGANAMDPAVAAPTGQAVEEVYAPDAPAAVEAQEEAAADPEVQASVEALEQSFTAPPEALQNNGDVLGTTERRIDTVRSAGEEYRGGVMASGGDRDSARAQAARDRDERRDRLEGAGLGFIAGLVVGALIDNRQEVVATTPERIVVIDRTTNVYQVWRDDDVLLRRPGTQETIRNYRDGSTRTVLAYSDGSTVETIRDATGRVVYRQRTEGQRRVILINETRAVGSIDVRTLPAPRVRDIRIPNGIDPYFGAELVRSSATPVDRYFTLGQVRNVAQVRALAPALATDPVLFASGSTALDPRQAGALSGLAGVMLAMLETNPGEMFLVEGHTDAVGSAASNLALSDRRAETVASALVEYFGVPPENLVFQGYGEALLKVRTAADEPRNRRVEIRRITPLLAQNK